MPAMAFHAWVFLVAVVVWNAFDALAVGTQGKRVEKPWVRQKLKASVFSAT